MRRIAGAVLLAIGLSAVLAFALGAKGPSGSGYEVRAIFDNASFTTPGEDVKVGGVKVGKIESLAVTGDKKAALTLTIDEPGFAPFRADAHCTIRPQSLIGERYVDCTPGTAAHPELAKVAEGRPGAGQHLLPVARNSSPVDTDLVASTLRLPYRQRLALVVNEFGTALAGRGGDLNDAIHRANPALRQTDEVLGILAQQNRTLANLASDSDAVLAPLAAKRRRVSHLVVAAGDTARATAERSADIQRGLQRLPRFLAELRPTLADLGDVSDQMTPVLADLRTAAPDLSRFVGRLGPFSRSATPALVSLGRAARIGGPALVRSRPLVARLAGFARHAGPVGRYLDEVTASLDRTGGIERLLDYVFFQMTAVNGFDGVSHYLRAGLITNPCSSYATTPTAGCNANFTSTKAIGSSAARSRGDRMLERLRERLAAQQAPAPKAGRAKAATRAAGGSPGVTDPFGALRSLTDPRIAEQRTHMLDTLRGASGESPAFGPASPRDQALEYLLGNGGGR